jgi:hypothetical protein
MPVYRNDNDFTVIVENQNGVKVPIGPGESVTTYKTYSVLTVTSETPRAGSGPQIPPFYETD